MTRYNLLKQRCIDRYKISFDKGKCAWCKTLLSGRRKTWCSEECFYQFYLRVNWETARKAAVQRSGGKCSICKINFDELFRAMISLPKYSFRYNIHSYEVDHIIPVSEGGDNEPENLRALCIFCHKEETKKMKKNTKRKQKTNGRF